MRYRSFNDKKKTDNNKKAVSSLHKSLGRIQERFQHFEHVPERTAFTCRGEIQFLPLFPCVELVIQPTPNRCQHECESGEDRRVYHAAKAEEVFDRTDCSFDHTVFLRGVVGGLMTHSSEKNPEIPKSAGGILQGFTEESICSIEEKVSVRKLVILLAFS